MTTHIKQGHKLRKNQRHLRLMSIMSHNCKDFLLQLNYRPYTQSSPLHNSFQNKQKQI